MACPCGRTAFDRPGAVRPGHRPGAVRPGWHRRGAGTDPEQLGLALGHPSLPVWAVRRDGHHRWHPEQVPAPGMPLTVERADREAADTDAGKDLGGEPVTPRPSGY